MATVRITPTDVQVDEMIYTFSDADIADSFESCIATTGDVAHCMKEQVVTGSRPTAPAERLQAIE